MSLQIKLELGDITEYAGDALIVNLFRGVSTPGGATGAVDAALDGAISDAIAREQFKGNFLQRLVLPTYGRLPVAHVIVVGLGAQAKFDVHRARRVAAAAARRARLIKAKTAATIVHGAGIGGLDAAAAAKALAQGTMLGLYRFDKYRRRAEGAKEESSAQLAQLTVVERNEEALTAIAQGLEQGQIAAAGTNAARDLINEPPSRLTPTKLAQAAQQSQSDLPGEVKILNKADLEELGFHAVLAVARGSHEPPTVSVLSYKGRGSQGYDLALVGKGVTFDSGGLSLKPAGGMEQMKYDMAGAAAVIGAMQVIARLQPEIDVLAIVPAVENLPGHKALKPGDIIDTLDGRTIEVLNTDAEGRLILADGVAYARRQGARRIVDVATLTGAARIALGPVTTALISNDDPLAEDVLQAAEQAGEPLWRLPAWDDYKSLYKSRVADLKNTAGRQGGTITGGLIVGEFADKTPWAHLDIAATAWLDRRRADADAGATGVMVPTLVNLVLNLAARPQALADETNGGQAGENG